MKAFAELAPWRVYSLGKSPFVGWWCFNPSIIRTPESDHAGARWLCSIRVSNYHMPGSRPDSDPPKGPIRNRNLLVELDPATWRPIRTVEIFDRSIEGKRGTWTGAGFEDLRLVWTDRGLCAIASAMRPNADTGGVVEIVVLDLDTDYQIVQATPLRGPWSAQHQKNWSQYQGHPSGDLRMLYSTLDGGVHNRTRRIVPVHDPITVDNPFQPRAITPLPTEHPISQLPTRFDHGAIEVQIRRGPERLSHRAKTASPPPVRLALRGGSQLIQIDREIDRWLGLAHGCRVEAGGFKFYWHYWFEVDSDGVMLSLSDPFKIDPDVGIEFASGLAYDRAAGELVVSYGLEDDRAMLGVTELDAVVALLRPVGTTAGARFRADTQPLPGPVWDHIVAAACAGGSPEASASMREQQEQLAAVAGGAPTVVEAWQPKKQPTMASMRAALDYLRANIPDHDVTFDAAEDIAAGRQA